jgi:multisubunit Na+/H+ antiporter MnhC subunit
MSNATWEGWGNWTQNPGMTLDCFWCENPLYFSLKYKEKAEQTLDPIVIILASTVIVVIVVAVVATVLLRKKKERKMLEEEEEPEEEK